MQLRLDLTAIYRMGSGEQDPVCTSKDRGHPYLSTPRPMPTDTGVCFGHRDIPEDGVNQIFQDTKLPVA